MADILSEVNDPERSVTFDEESVNEWCERNDAPIRDSDTFGQRIVPCMMLMDELEGLIADMEDDSEVIIAGVTAARFRDPVLIGETVDYGVEVVEELTHKTIVDFAACVDERDSLVLNGSLTVVIR